MCHFFVVRENSTTRHFSKITFQFYCSCITKSDASKSLYLILTILLLIIILFSLTEITDLIRRLSTGTFLVGDTDFILIDNNYWLTILDSRAFSRRLQYVCFVSSGYILCYWYAQFSIRTRWGHWSILKFKRYTMRPTVYIDDSITAWSG